MRVTLKLYSANKSAVTSSAIEKCLREIDYLTVEVSRTVGPANYFDIEKSLLKDDAEPVAFPVEDISRMKYSNSAEMARLFREGSFLKVHFTRSGSRRIGAIGQELSQLTRGLFFWSDSSLGFGPCDITQGIETPDGEEDVRLVDVAHFVFSITCDNFTDDPNILAERSMQSTTWVELQRSFELIVGPLTLFVSF